MIQTKYKDELPYEKCLEQGADSLTNTELLAVLLRTGTKGFNVLELAEYILSSSCGDSGILNIHNCTLEKLTSIRGIGNVKAVQILCLSELAKRLDRKSVV